MSSIQERIDEQIREMKITSLDISFNELADMYKDGELIISPDYQRLFRWDIGKQSRFIESLLLEMPIPPIYVIEIDNGKYELIDGLQRISTYLCFRGFLQTTENDQLDDTSNDVENDDDVYDDIESESYGTAKNSFKLEDCDIVTDLNGCGFDDLPTNLKIKAKRCFVRMEVLRKGINPTMKYHMFKRLNTGGEKLSPQEIRNCSIRLIDSKFIDFINSLTRNTDFQETIKDISKGKKQKKYAEELVLRFFAIKNDFDSFSHHIDEFLTNYIEKVSINDNQGSPIFDYDEEQKTFEKVFSLLNQILGKNTFKAYRLKTNSLSSFNVYVFEAISFAFPLVLSKIDSHEISLEELKNRIDNTKKEDEFKQYTVGGGKNSSGVMKKRCEFMKSRLEA